MTEQLINLIETHGLTAVVDQICDICYEHASQCRKAGDVAMAARWDASGASLVNPDQRYGDLKFPS